MPVPIKRSFVVHFKKSQISSIGKLSLCGTTLLNSLNYLNVSKKSQSRYQVKSLAMALTHIETYHLKKTFSSI